MIDLIWLSDRLVEALRWQLANPDDKQGGPEVPFAGRRVWGMFLELNATRGAGGFGPNPIGYAEIEAWRRLRREPVRSFELDILRALDAAYLECVAASREGSETKISKRPFSFELFDAQFGGGSAVSTRPMSPALFDAVFPG